MSGWKRRNDNPDLIKSQHLSALARSCVDCGEPEHYEAHSDNPAGCWVQRHDIVLQNSPCPFPDFP
jgi:hypothetical protein